MFRLLDGLSDEDHSSGSQDLDNSQDTAGSSAVEGPPNDAPTTAAAATAAIRAAKSWESTVLQRAADWAWPSWRRTTEQYLKHALALELLEVT